MSILKLINKYKTGELITMLTCYDYPMASMIASTDLDAVLVGDTLAMIVHGHADTTTATLPMMVMHTQAVAKAKMPQVIVADLPFLSANLSPRDTLVAAGQLIQAGAQAVKIEGCDRVVDSIQACTQSGIPVMAHLGLTPQYVHQLGGFKVQGKTKEAQERLMQDAKRCEKAGAFALVLECVPPNLADSITQSVNIPTIGIGAGSKTSGQILVLHDMLGLTVGRLPRFVKQYAQAASLCEEAVSAYVSSVKSGQFPQKEHEYKEVVCEL